MRLYGLINDALHDPRSEYAYREPEDGGLPEHVRKCMPVNDEAEPDYPKPPRVPDEKYPLESLDKSYSKDKELE